LKPGCDWTPDSFYFDPPSGRFHSKADRFKGTINFEDRSVTATELGLCFRAKSQDGSRYYKLQLDLSLRGALQAGFTFREFSPFGRRFEGKIVFDDIDLTVNAPVYDSDGGPLDQMTPVCFSQRCWCLHLKLSPPFV